MMEYEYERKCQLKTDRQLCIYTSMGVVGQLHHHLARHFSNYWH
jgi:hypothetical protein